MESQTIRRKALHTDRFENWHKTIWSYCDQHVVCIRETTDSRLFVCGFNLPCQVRKEREGLPTLHLLKVQLKARESTNPLNKSDESPYVNHTKSKAQEPFPKAQGFFFSEVLRTFLKVQETFLNGQMVFPKDQGSFLKSQRTFLSVQGGFPEDQEFSKIQETTKNSGSFQKFR